MSEETGPGMGPGLFGKLPSRGDFVVRRLDPACRAALDDWLQACVATSRRHLGDAWLDAFLNAPIWRFALGPGACGAAPLAGVMMPSVDRVGRYFPLVLAARLPATARPEELLRGETAWFDALDALALSALRDETDLTELDAAVGAAGLPTLAETGTAEDANIALFWLAADAGAPVALLTRGLPPPRGFATMLTLHWPGGPWREAPEQTVEGVTVLMEEEAARIASAGRTHAGTRRPMNQDALLLRPDQGLWAVADGVGGHQDGDVASRAVIEHLERVLPPVEIEDTLDEVRDRLTEANAALRERAGRIGETAITASTVAVLVLHGGRTGVLWSGDSRVYRWRAGELACLTRDHVDAGRVRHAVGAADILGCERAVHVTWPGDRYLLCSDGLTTALTEAEIAANLRPATPAEAVAALLDDALVAGAGDNVTAVVVDVPRAV